MTARRRRRRGLVLVAAALVCGGVAASEVSTRTGELERRIGVPVPVVVAARDLEPSTELRPDDLMVAHVPSRYAPPDAPTAPAQAVGFRTAGPVAAGSPVTAGVIGSTATASGPAGLRPGERVVEVEVAGAATLGEAAGPATLVDVLVTTDPAHGPGQTFVALERVQLIDLASSLAPGSPSLEDPDAGTGRTATAMLRVTARQAVYLTAAQAFAREIRLLPRPAGDREDVGRSPTTASGL